MPSVLKIYNTPLITFEMNNKGLDGFTVTVLDHAQSKRHLFPLNLEPENTSLANWLRKRVIPKNRAFVHQILKQLNLNINDTKGIIEACKGLSLNDSYWIVPDDFSGSFGEYNLYENRFSNVLSLVAYTGYGTSHQAFTTSPELTTDGMLPKSWRLINGEISLWKGGSSGAANTGMEPYSEFYAAQVAKVLGLNHVNYDLRKWKGKLCSVCPLFTDIDTAYVPIGRIVTKGGLTSVLKYYRSLSEEAYQEVASMLIMDAVIYNDDRHFANFGVLRENQTGKIIASASIFDNGLSLFSYAMESELDDLESYAKDRFSATGVSHDEITKTVLGAGQRAQLRKLIGFEFTPHPSYNWPVKRKKAIEQFLQKRIKCLLNYHC